MKRVMLLLLVFSVTAKATVAVVMHSTVYPKQVLGTITFKNTPFGLLITPDMKGLKPGLHGFHIHEKPDCGHSGHSAGGHFDPENTGQHLGPFNAKGHLGDLPALYVSSTGVANHTILAPRLKEHDLYGHAIMIHAGGDNYADQPAKLGGGGKRIGCAVVVKPAS